MSTKRQEGTNPHGVGIIGAGISGILAARVLAEGNVSHWIIDKGRGVGGRMATRRIGDTVVDHGAQYFTARDPRFRALVEDALQAGVLREWATGFRLGDGSIKDSGEPRAIGANGINAFPRALAEGLNVERSTQATAIRHDGQSWVVDIKDAPARRAAALIVTTPAPQSLALIDAGGVTLPADARQALARIEYDPCFALLVVCDGTSNIPEPGGLWPDDGPFAWIADNRQKGITQRTTMTFHTRPQYTRAHLNDDRDTITRDLLEAAKQYLGGDIIDHQLHRWLYSIPTVTHPERLLVVQDPGVIIFAGDAFGGPRVEGAALSGLAAGDYLNCGGKNSS